MTLGFIFRNVVSSICLLLPLELNEMIVFLTKRVLLFLHHGSFFLPEEPCSYFTLPATITCCVHKCEMIEPPC